MAPQVFCSDKIKSTAFDEDYRLGIFIYWAKSKQKRPPIEEDNLGLNVPFCIQVFQRSNPDFSPVLCPSRLGQRTGLKSGLDLWNTWMQNGTLSPRLSSSIGGLFCLDFAQYMKIPSL